MSSSTKLAAKIWTQFADHHPGPRLLEVPHLEALQKTAFDHSSIQVIIFLLDGRQPQKKVSIIKQEPRKAKTTSNQEVERPQQALLPRERFSPSAHTDRSYVVDEWPLLDD